MSIHRILPAIGPVILGFLCLAQAYSRAGINVSYPLLLLWGCLWLVQGRRRWSKPVKPLPLEWLRGLAIFLAVYLLTALIGSEPLRSLTYLSINLYVFLALPVTWLALSQWPNFIYFLPYCYGAGLILTGLITFQQANYCLSCVRAMSYLGIIDLSGVLIQITPLMVGALAMAQSDHGRKKIAKTIFFLLALAGAFVAMINNCTRITLLGLPFLCAVMFLVNYKNFKNAIGLFFFLLALLGSIYIVKNGAIIDRFKDMTAPTSLSLNNTERFNYWEHGYEVFKEHPIFGVGPAAKPNIPVEKRVRPSKSAFQHAHNVFLTIMAEMGLIGLVAFLYFITRPVKILWPYRRSPDQLTFFWTWSAFMVICHLFLNGITDYVFGNKMMMFLHFSIVGAALWVAEGRQDPKLEASPAALKP
ncbi:MAG: O-antigen ligase family protein [Deltaproteobacteria bacterium]|jgi:O-antigen ligase|nr:O-antigen ligase family protein [Deltaproteobacteria bacterium]